MLSILNARKGLTFFKGEEVVFCVVLFQCTLDVLIYNLYCHERKWPLSLHVAKTCKFRSVNWLACSKLIRSLPIVQ